MHTICVLGGSGFIGTYLLNQLTGAGHQLRVLTRRREAHKQLWVMPTVQLIEGDVHDEDFLARHVRGCDAVVNLVGILNEAGRDGSGFRRAHVDLVRNVARACQAQGVRRLLHMSALGADALQGTSHYLRTKGIGEDTAHAAAGPQLHVTSFRPSVVFGPGDGFFNRFASLLTLAPYWFPLACADSRFAPVYVQDVAAAMVQCMDASGSFGKRYELCGPRVYTLRELVSYTARVLGLRRSVVALPDALARLQAALLERVPGKPFSRDNYGSLQTPSVCGGSAAGFAALGIAPAPLEAVVPHYLGHATRQQQLDVLRRAAGGGRTE